MASCDYISPDKALIFDIYRGTSHDGPGLRSTVFFKGCPLSCAWCHNPEGQSLTPAVWWDRRSCIGCGLCHEACKNGANIIDGQGIHIDRGKCLVCGACVKECPAKALEMIGTAYCLEELVKTVLKDKAYYDQTGGGVTASGGEAMMQAAFIESFFARLHQEGVNTALDTCGHAPWSVFEKVLANADYVLFDLKLADPKAHALFTGVDNSLILENAVRIAQGIRKGSWNTKLWIRTPLIPGATATEDNLRDIGRFIFENLEGVVSRWELPAFNNSCTRKYEKLGEAWQYADKELISAAQAQALKAAAASGGVDSSMIFVTGIIAGSQEADE